MIREELGGIIASEVAKLRLTDPDSIPLTTLITNGIAHQLNIQVTPDELLEARKSIRRRIDSQVSDYVSARVREAIKSVLPQ